MNLLPSCGRQAPPHSLSNHYSKGGTSLYLFNNPSNMSNQGIGLIHTLPLCPLHHQERITFIHAHVLFSNLPPNM